VWEFVGPDGPERIRVGGTLVTNSGQVLKDAVLSGLGLTVKSTWDVSAELEDGRLRAVLQDYPVFSDMAFYVLFPSAKQLSPKVRAFVDFLVERSRTGREFAPPAGVPGPAKVSGG